MEVKGVSRAKDSVITKEGVHILTLPARTLNLTGRILSGGVFIPLPFIRHLQFHPGKLEVSIPPRATVDAALAPGVSGHPSRVFQGEVYRLQNNLCRETGCRCGLLGTAVCTP